MSGDKRSDISCCRTEFQSDSLNVNWVENLDETHFVYVTDNMVSLEHKGKSVKYFDFVSGGTGMTVRLRIAGGPTSKPAALFFIFHSSSAN